MHEGPGWPLVMALRDTAARLASGARYRWAHMGACNCGHLAQTVTALPADEIHRRALARAGDWGEQVVEHCAASGLPIDDVVSALLALGLSTSDLGHLERLADRHVRAALPPERRAHLDYRRREDVVLYMETWADQIEDRLRARGSFPPLAVAAA
jgi:hypothetical protein